LIFTPFSAKKFGARGLGIESFNGRLRDEFLNLNEFASIEDAKRRIENWRQD